MDTIAHLVKSRAAIYYRNYRHIRTLYVQMHSMLGNKIQQKVKCETSSHTMHELF